MDSNVVDAVFCDVTWGDIVRDMFRAGEGISLPEDLLSGVILAFTRLPDASEEDRRAVAKCLEMLSLAEKEIAKTCSRIGEYHGKQTSNPSG